MKLVQRIHWTTNFLNHFYYGVCCPLLPEATHQFLNSHSSSPLCCSCALSFFSGWEKGPLSTLQGQYLVTAYSPRVMFHHPCCHVSSPLLSCFITLVVMFHYPCCHVSSPLLSCFITLGAMFHHPWCHVSSPLLSCFITLVVMFHHPCCHVSSPLLSCFITLVVMFHHPCCHVQMSQAITWPSLIAAEKEKLWPLKSVTEFSRNLFIAREIHKKIVFSRL